MCWSNTFCCQRFKRKELLLCSNYVSSYSLYAFHLSRFVIKNLQVLGSVSWIPKCSTCRHASWQFLLWQTCIPNEKICQMVSMLWILMYQLIGHEVSTKIKEKSKRIIDKKKTRSNYSWWILTGWLASGAVLQTELVTTRSFVSILESKYQKQCFFVWASVLNEHAQVVLYEMCW